MTFPTKTGRIEYSFTEEEVNTLVWLIQSEIKVQQLLIDESDGTLLAELQELYEVFTW